ncbi:hypothetical protein FYM76_00440 [Lactobacillus salivarius]|uniref:hypothetical protein n=1 Tax=Ligilactobacillus salivarius TaxID=1624 RepID=UPI00136B7D5E|nr:hypothetical protein [Ligilactobacillus salivarius]MYV23839.1 hypothetical protein [Ligilactobacillus salivarius]
MKIIDKFSIKTITLLTVDEDLPENVRVGYKDEIDGEAFTITGIPIIETKPLSINKRTFMIDRTDEVDVNQIVKFYKA